MKPKRYEFPNEPKIELWDLPGFGTEKMGNLQTYYTKFGIPKFDVFIIMIDVRVTNDSLELAKKLHLDKKPFFFVRSKMDTCIANAKVDMKKEFTPKKVFDQIHDEFRKEMKEKCKGECKGMKNSQIGDLFLISSRNPNAFDFGKLITAITKNLEDMQKECFIYSLPILSEEVLVEKVNLFKGM